MQEIGSDLHSTSSGGTEPHWACLESRVGHFKQLGKSGSECRVNAQHSAESRLSSLRIGGSESQGRPGEAFRHRNLDYTLELVPGFAACSTWVVPAGLNLASEVPRIHPPPRFPLRISFLTLNDPGIQVGEIMFGGFPQSCLDSARVGGRAIPVSFLDDLVIRRQFRPPKTCCAAVATPEERCPCCCR